MGRLQAATSVTITVLGTLVVAALAYAGTTGWLHPSASIHPVPPAPSPTPAAVIPSPTPALSGPFVIDQDLLDASTVRMLVSDCPLRGNPTCRNFVVRSDDGGQTWTDPVQVGPEVAITDGGAPRTIRFLNSRDGFVYGGTGAFVTHDGGKSWGGLGFPAVFIGTIALSDSTVWATTYPCPKGTLCAYELRSSQDGGRTWSKAYRLPLNFSPENAVAFKTGVLLSSPTQGALELTTDQGATWRAITLPCAQDAFRSSATTADGVEVWGLCQPYPDASGQITAESLFVSENAGKTWSRRNLGRLLPGWLVTLQPHVALTASNHTTLVTRDGGVTWSEVQPQGLDLLTLRFNPTGWGWGLDSERNLWASSDAGEHWTQIGALPGRLS